MNFSFCQACGLQPPIKDNRYCVQCARIMNPILPKKMTPTIDPMPHKKESRASRRKKRISENGGSHTNEEWMILLEKYQYKCAHCGIHASDTPQKYLTKDHIIPICHSGRDDIANIQPLCLRCNFRKSTKII